MSSERLKYTPGPIEAYDVARDFFLSLEGGNVDHVFTNFMSWGKEWWTSTKVTLTDGNTIELANMEREKAFIQVYKDKMAVFSVLVEKSGVSQLLIRNYLSEVTVGGEKVGLQPQINLDIKADEESGRLGEGWKLLEKVLSWIGETVKKGKVEALPVLSLTVSPKPPVIKA